MAYTDAPNGVRLYYETAGPPDGPPVLLLHGATQDGTVWHTVKGSLARSGYQAFALDLPGHGKSDVDVDDPRYDVPRYAEVVGSFLRTAVCRPAVLVGHSMSGGVTLQTLLDGEDSSIGAVILDGTSYSRGYEPWMLELISIDVMQWLEVNFRSICSRSSDPARIDDVAAGLGRCPEAVAWNDMVAFAGLDLRPRLAEISVPLAFLHGKEDWAIPVEMAEETRRLCARSATRIEVIEGVGHFPHQEDPERTDPLLCELVSWVVEKGTK